MDVWIAYCSNSSAHELHCFHYVVCFAIGLVMPY